MWLVILLFMILVIFAWVIPATRDEEKRRQKRENAEKYVEVEKELRKKYPNATENEIDEKIREAGGPYKPSLW